MRTHICVHRNCVHINTEIGVRTHIRTEFEQANPNQLWGTALTGLHEAYTQVIAPTFLCCCLRITTGLRTKALALR